MRLKKRLFQIVEGKVSKRQKVPVDFVALSSVCCLPTPYAEAIYTDSSGSHSLGPGSASSAEALPPPCCDLLAWPMAVNWSHSSLIPKIVQHAD